MRFKCVGNLYFVSATTYMHVYPTPPKGKQSMGKYNCVKPYTTKGCVVVTYVLQVTSWQVARLTKSQYPVIRYEQVWLPAVSECKQQTQCKAWEQD